MISVNDTWSDGMITNFAQTFLKLIKVESCVVPSFRMSGGPNSNPLNGRLPPDWNRYPSMNTYQPNPCCNTYINAPPNSGANGKPANAFGYNNNVRNTHQPYISPATYMWNNQMPYQQNCSQNQQANVTSHPFPRQQQAVAQPVLMQHAVAQPVLMQQAQPQINFTDFLPNYPSLSDRFTFLENQIDSSFAQHNSNTFGSALNGFVQDMMYVAPPLPLLQAPAPVTTTLYQAQLYKNHNLANKTPETDDFASQKELFKYQEKISTLDDSNLPTEGAAFKFNADGVSQLKCTTQKLHRQWQTTRPPSNSDRSFHFSILNYNVLAQDLLQSHPELYYKNDERALDWPLRWSNLKEEFQKLNCDIICLQEVQESHKDLFDATFKNLGYSGLYKKRTGSKTDGCSIYYRETMFKLLESITVEYNQPRVGILDRDNIAIIAKFLAKGNNQEIIVANTHLLFNPRRQDIRLVQTQLLLTEIDRMAFKYCADQSLCEYHPVILVGDFNSTPDSSVVHFIKNGCLTYEHLNKRTLSRENVTSPTGKVLIPPFLRITDCCQHTATDIIRDSKLSSEEQLIKLPLYNSEYKKQQPFLAEDTEHQKQFSTGTLRHKFQFQSVYNHGTFDNPEGTTNQGEWITTDYIFFNRSSGIRGKDWKLNLIARYILPTLHDLRNVAIPNYELGSDHLSLVAKFSLKTP